MALRAKLITIFLTLLLPTIGLMVVFYTRISIAYENQTERYQIATLKMTASDLKDIFSEARGILFTTNRYGRELMTENTCPKILAPVAGAESLFHTLVLVDLQGNVICSTGRIDVSDVSSTTEFPDLIKRVITGNTFVVSTLLAENQDEDNELIMGHPVGDEEGRIIAVLIGFLNDKGVKGVWKNIEITSDIQISIFNRNGYVMNYPVFGNESNRHTLSRVLAEAYENSNEIPMEEKIIKISGLDQLRWTFRFARLDPASDYYVSVGFPESKQSLDVRQFMIGNMLIVFLLTLALLFISYGGLELSLVRPVKAISRAAEKIAGGDLSARTGLKYTRDELGRLSQIFDRMAESLEQNRLNLEEETTARLSSQERFFRLFEDAILGIFQLDEQSRLVEANTALARMFGYNSPEEMIAGINQPAGNLFVDKKDNDRIDELISSRQPVQMDTRLVKKDGTEFYGNLHMWGVWDSSGSLEAMEGFIEDVTVSKRVQAQLVKLSQAVEQNPIGIVITDGKGSIEYANPGIYNVFGFQPDELIGKATTFLVNDENNKQLVDDIRQKIIAGSSYRGEVRNFKKNGEPFWERFVISPITIPDSPTNQTLCLLEDISEQHWNKERITQQVEELSALRTIDLAISSNLDLQATLNIIANLAVKHLKADSVCIQLYDSQHHMLVNAAHLGLDYEPSQQIPFPAAADLTEWELVEEFSVHIPEKLNDQRLSHRIPFPDGNDYEACFGLPLVAKAEVKGLFRVFFKQPFTPEQHWLDFFYNLATQTAVAIDNFELFSNLKQSNVDLLEAYEATIEGWSKALNYRDQETEQHSIRTTNWTLDLAKNLGFSEEELVHVRRGALLHDIGKVSVPDRILNKPGPLTEDEWIEMRKHPKAAYDVLYPIKFLNKALDIPYYHHERWDGTGYPNGLKGKEIPLAARIFAVIDVYDALTSDRPYRSAWTEEKVIQYLRDQSGAHFDPEIVDAFLSLLERQRKT